MNPFQSINKGFTKYLSTPFVSKLNAAGDALQYSTYIGGSSSIYGVLKGDRSLAIAVDAAGSAYIMGITYSTDFPLSTGAFQTVNKDATTYEGNAGSFVTKLGTAETV